MARDPGYEDDDDYWRSRYEDMKSSAPPMLSKPKIVEDKQKKFAERLAKRVEFQEAEIARLNNLNGAYYQEIQRLKASVSDHLESIKQKVEELGRVAMQAADPPEYRDGWVSGLRQAQDEVLQELGTSASGKRIIDSLQGVIDRIERQSKTKS